MKDQKKYVFIAHWVESWNIFLKWIKILNQYPQFAWLLIPLAPIYKLVSVAYLYRKKSHDTVDVFNKNTPLSGEIRLVSNFGWHFMLKKYHNSIKERIVKTILAAQGDDPAEYPDAIGLGALIKAEWLTKGGAWIVETLGEKLKVPIVHGDTLTAAVAINQAAKVIRLQKISSPVLVTGATSKIGRPLCLAIAMKMGLKVKMYTKSRKRFLEIQKEAGKYGHLLEQVLELPDAKDCQLWITGKAIPSGNILLRYIPKGASVLNFSVPNPLSQKILKVRRDIYSVECGLLAFDPTKTEQRFLMRCSPGKTYACHVGTMVHAHKGWTHHEVGPVAMHKLKETWQAAKELGFYLPALPPLPVQQTIPEKRRSEWRMKDFAHQLRIL